jgi:hypothetical protein
VLLAIEASEWSTVGDLRGDAHTGPLAVDGGIDQADPCVALEVCPVKVVGVAVFSGCEVVGCTIEVAVECSREIRLRDTLG